MALVIFVNADGTKTEIDIEDGISVMEGGVRGGVDGLDADCGGQGACATCPVYVDPLDGLVVRVPSEQSGL